MEALREHHTHPGGAVDRLGGHLEIELLAVAAHGERDVLPLRGGGDQLLVADHVVRRLSADGDEHVAGLEDAVGRSVLEDPADQHRGVVVDAELVQGDRDRALLGGVHLHRVVQRRLLRGLALGEHHLAREHGVGPGEPGDHDLRRGDRVSGAAVDRDGGEHQRAVRVIGLGAVDDQDLLVLVLAEHVDRGAGPFDDVRDRDQGAAHDHRAQQGQGGQGEARFRQLHILHVSAHDGAGTGENGGEAAHPDIVPHSICAPLDRWARRPGDGLDTVSAPRRPTHSRRCP